MVRTMKRKYLVEVSLGGMGKEDHFTEICSDELNAAVVWNMEDKWILALLINSIDIQTHIVITHCKWILTLLVNSI